MEDPREDGKNYFDENRSQITISDATSNFVATKEPMQTEDSIPNRLSSAYNNTFRTNINRDNSFRVKLRSPINVQNFELDSFTQRVVATPKENSRV